MNIINDQIKLEASNHAELKRKALEFTHEPRSQGQRRSFHPQRRRTGDHPRAALQPPRPHKDTDGCKNRGQDVPRSRAPRGHRRQPASGGHARRTPLSPRAHAPCHGGHRTMRTVGTRIRVRPSHTCAHYCFLNVNPFGPTTRSLSRHASFRADNDHTESRSSITANRRRTWPPHRKPRSSAGHRRTNITEPESRLHPALHDRQCLHSLR